MPRTCGGPDESDPAPLSRHQALAVARATARELGGLRAVRREVARWRRRAEAIPDPMLRDEALTSLRTKRSLVEGAARFWNIPSRADPALLRVLVAFEVMADFLDLRSEATIDQHQGTVSAAIEAFVDAVDIERPLSDYYRDRPGRDDGGYLRTLVSTCRAGCAVLPHYAEARPLLAHHAYLARSLDLQHAPDPVRRDRTLVRFATDEIGCSPGASWFEQTAGTSSALIVIVLLTVAADENATVDDLHAAATAYVRTASLGMLLDSYADQLDDALTGQFSLIAYYPDQQAAVARIGVLIDQALREVRALRHGERHVLLVSMMVALFLSHDGARDERLLAGTRALVRSGGSLTRLLVPILRVWRIGYRQRSG